MNDFIKNPQTRNACTFWPLNISAVGSVTTVERGMVWLVGRKNCLVFGAFSVALSEEYILGMLVWVMILTINNLESNIMRP